MRVFLALVALLLGITLLVSISVWIPIVAILIALAVLGVKLTEPKPVRPMRFDVKTSGPAEVSVVIGDRQPEWVLPVGYAPGCHCRGCRALSEHLEQGGLRPEKKRQALPQFQEADGFPGPFAGHEALIAWAEERGELQHRLQNREDRYPDA